MTELFAALDLSSVAASVTTVGVSIIGIALVYKGVGLVKRALKLG